MMEFDADLLSHATEEELEALAHLLEMQEHLSSPAAYGTYVSKGQRDEFVHYKHVEYLDNVLLELVSGKSFKRLLITEPPRHGKSEHTSKYFPAWFLTTRPWEKILFASYEHDFAAEWTEKVQTLIKDHPELGARLDRARKDDFTLLGGGLMLADGVGGAFTGRGGNILVDDPIKNSDVALSEVQRKNQKNWWESTIERRREPGAWTVLIMTRWHEDDLGGWLLERDGEYDPVTNPDGWFVVRLPALAEEDDPLGREPGEALCPERFTREELEQMREEMDPFWWNAMYQQNPVDPEGNIIPVDKFVPVDLVEVGGGQMYRWNGSGGEEYIPLEKCIRICTLDLAATEKNYSDFTVAMVVDVLPLPEGVRRGPRRGVVRHVRRERIETGKHISFVREVIEQWGCVGAWVEKSTYGLALLQQGRRQGLRLHELDADRDKVARSLEGSGMLRAERLGLVSGTPWAPEFLAEMAAFPVGRHDDMVDCWSYSCRTIEKLSTAGVKAVGGKPDAPYDPTERSVAYHVERFFGARKRRRHPNLGRW